MKNLIRGAAACLVLLVNLAGTAWHSVRFLRGRTYAIRQ